MDARQRVAVVFLGLWCDAGGSGDPRLYHTVSSITHLDSSFQALWSISGNQSLAGDVLVTSLDIPGSRKAFSPLYVCTALSLNVLTVLNSVTNNMNLSAKGKIRWTSRVIYIICMCLAKNIYWTTRMGKSPIDFFSLNSHDNR